jgi:hypothetical protein
VPCHAVLSFKQIGHVAPAQLHQQTPVIHCGSSAFLARAWPKFQVHCSSCSTAAAAVLCIRLLFVAELVSCRAGHVFAICCVMPSCGPLPVSWALCNNQDFQIALISCSAAKLQTPYTAKQPTAADQRTRLHRNHAIKVMITALAVCRYIRTCTAVTM